MESEIYRISFFTTFFSYRCKKDKSKKNKCINKIWLLLRCYYQQITEKKRMSLQFQLSETVEEWFETTEPLIELWTLRINGEGFNQNRRITNKVPASTTLFEFSEPKRTRESDDNSVPRKSDAQKKQRSNKPSSTGPKETTMTTATSTDQQNPSNDQQSSQNLSFLEKSLQSLPKDLQYQIAIQAGRALVQPSNSETYVDLFMICDSNTDLKGICRRDPEIRAGIAKMFRDFAASGVYQSEIFGNQNPKFLYQALRCWRDVYCQYYSLKLDSGLEKISSVLGKTLDDKGTVVSLMKYVHNFQWLYADSNLLHASTLMNINRANRSFFIIPFTNYDGTHRDEGIFENYHQDFFLKISQLVEALENGVKKTRAVSENFLLTLTERIVWLLIALSRGSKTPEFFDVTNEISVLSKFSNLHTLEIYSLIKDRRFPAIIGKRVPHLKRLLLNDCEIDDIPEDSFASGDFPNLEFLHWTESDATSITAAWIAVNLRLKRKMTGVFRERPGEEIITQILPTGFCKLPKLKHLILVNVIHSIPTNIGDLSNTLETLFIIGSPILSFPDSMFRLKNLKRLSIQNHALEAGYLSEEFIGLENLQWLHIIDRYRANYTDRETSESDQNKLVEIPVTLTESMKNLTALILSDTIRTIDVDSKGKSQFGPERFASFNSIQALKLALSLAPKSIFPVDIFYCPEKLVVPKTHVFPPDSMERHVSLINRSDSIDFPPINQTTIWKKSRYGPNNHSAAKAFTFDEDAEGFNDKERGYQAKWFIHKDNVEVSSN